MRSQHSSMFIDQSTNMLMPLTNVLRRLCELCLYLALQLTKRCMYFESNAHCPFQKQILKGVINKPFHGVDDK
jgi:hypothetical protein